MFSIATPPLFLDTCRSKTSLVVNLTGNWFNIIWLIWCIIHFVKRQKVRFLTNTCVREDTFSLMRKTVWYQEEKMKSKKLVLANIKRFIMQITYRFKDPINHKCFSTDHQKITKHGTCLLTFLLSKNSIFSQKLQYRAMNTNSLSVWCLIFLPSAGSVFKSSTTI